MKRDIEFKRNPISILLAMFWQRELSVNSMYQVEKTLKIKASAFESQTGIRFHLGHEKEWIKYIRGQQLPNTSFVSEIEKLVPGSLRLRNHPLWEVCRLPPDEARIKAGYWFAQLAPAIVKRVLKEENGKLIRRRFSQQMLTALESRCDLDALAALCLLTLESAGFGRDDLAICAGAALFHSMLRLPFISPPYIATIAPDLFELFQANIFPYAQSERKYLAVEQVDYKNLIQLIQLVLEDYRKKDSSPDLSFLFERMIRSAWMTPVGMLNFQASIVDKTSASFQSDLIDWPKEWKIALQEWLSL